MEPPPDTFAPLVRFCDASGTWEEVGRDYLARIESRLQDDPSVAALAAQLTKGLDSDEAKLRAIAAHVQANYTYKALAFGARAQVPDPVAQVIERRYGDCKDLSFLLANPRANRRSATRPR